MHECPECGQACFCDMEDSEVMTPEWVEDNCEHECQPLSDEGDDDFFDGEDADHA